MMLQYDNHHSFKYLLVILVAKLLIPWSNSVTMTVTDTSTFTVNALPLNNLLCKNRIVEMGKRTYGWKHQQQQVQQRNVQDKTRHLHHRFSSLILTRLFDMSGGGGGGGGDEGRHLLGRRKMIVNVVTALGTILISAIGGLEIYSRLGMVTSNAKILNTFLPQNPDNGRSSTSWRDIKHLTIIIHGAGGQDEYTNALLQRYKESDNDNNDNDTFHVSIDWSEYSSNILQASYNGEKIGKEIARQLKEYTAGSNNLQTLHLIGISVGSFVADTIAYEMKQQERNNSRMKKVTNTNTNTDDISNHNINHNNDDNNIPYIQMTLLDPFTQRGIVGINYGIRQFGMYADYVQQYLNTDDPVPSTNGPLQNAICYDITNLRPTNEVIFGHDWPVIYFGKYVKNIGIISKEEQLSKGSVVVVFPPPSVVQ